MIFSLRSLIRVLCAIICGFCLYNASSLIQAFSFFKTQSGLHKTSIKHLGVIMDGNRRWARQHKFDPWIGHRHGVDPLKQTAQFCLKHSIKELTLYTLSLDNLDNRPSEELTYLFDVLAKELASNELNELLENGIRVHFVGDRSLFPPSLKTIIEDVEQRTAHQNKLTMNFLFCYGGKQELIHAIQHIAQQASQGLINPSSIDDAYIRSQLWSSHLTDPDLIIRTGKVSRLSSFLPYQSVYSELYFANCFWPEITEEHLIEAVSHYETTGHKKKFGS